MLPFFLLVGVFLLLVFYFTRSSSPAPTLCAENSDPYEIGKDDTCWGIVKSHGVSLDELQKEKPRHGLFTAADRDRYLHSTKS